MAVPKKKTSVRRKRLRHAHDALPLPALSICSNCGAQKRPHCVCHACGFYKGKLVIAQKQAVEEGGGDAT